MVYQNQSKENSKCSTSWRILEIIKLSWDESQGIKKNQVKLGFAWTSIGVRLSWVEQNKLAYMQSRWDTNTSYTLKKLLGQLRTLGLTHKQFLGRMDRQTNKRTDKVTQRGGYPTLKMEWRYIWNCLRSSQTHQMKSKIKLGCIKLDK